MITQRCTNSLAIIHTSSNTIEKEKLYCSCIIYIVNKIVGLFFPMRCSNVGTRANTSCLLKSQFQFFVPSLVVVFGVQEFIDKEAARRSTKHGGYHVQAQLMKGDLRRPSK